MLEAYRWRESTDDADFRFVDVPPPEIEEALSRSDPRLSDLRPNNQPPARWLLEQARAHGGLLGGSQNRLGHIRVDAICFPASAAHSIASALEQDWPAVDDDWPPAIELALAEAWESWDAEQSSWEGGGRELLGVLPDFPVFGLWWD